jgi:two-component system LytT family response regulator
MRTLKVALCDDELVARKRLTRLLEAIPGVDLVGAHEGAHEMLAQLEEDAVDVVLLDVDMPGLSGLEAHAVLGEDGPYVVFTTAHPEHAVKAFELGAVDYVLKPIEAGRLAKAIDRARKHLEGRMTAPPAGPDPGGGRLPVVTRQGIVLLDPMSVRYAVFDGSLVTIHTTGGATHLTDATLQELHARLPDPRFDRVHRRVLLNLHEVTLLRPTDSGGFVAEVGDGGEVPISRQSARRLRKALGLAKA